MLVISSSIIQHTSLTSCEVIAYCHETD